MGLNAVDREEGEALARVGAPVPRVEAPLGSRTHLGYVRDGEKHSKLKTPQSRAREFEGVLRSNPVAAMAWRHYRSLMLQPQWYAEAPANAGPRAQSAAKFLNESLGLDGHTGAWDASWSCSFEALVGHMIDADWYGWSIAEVVPRVVGRRAVIDRYIAIEHPALDSWQVDPDGRVVGANLEGVGPDGRFHRALLPSRKWIHHTHGGSAQSPEGRGLARAIYAIHVDLMDAYNALAAACQRWSAPTPMGSYDLEKAEEATSRIGGDTVTVQTELDGIETQLRNYTSDGAAHLLIPSWLDLGAFGESVKPDQGVPAIRHLESRLAVTFFAHGMMLGLDQTGARSVGEVGERAAENQVINRCEALAASLHRGLVRPLMQWNYPSLTPQQWPRLRFAGARAGSFRHYANVLAQFAQHGGVDLDSPEVRRAIHRELGLPVPSPGAESPADVELTETPEVD